MPTITVACRGLLEAEGSVLPESMLLEFSHRPWNSSIKCEWDAGVLRLTATNDHDEDGQALLDEFGDAVIAYCSPANTISFSVESIS
ncbi:hypothetical protein ACNI65_17010 [Roseateles sp. So40a]|uniref:hypothetical protein n=1 Tax=Roseateles sp. So40a TaxID=3400226 RepID=UPI003A882294